MPRASKKRAPDPRISARDAYRTCIREAAERELVRVGFGAAKMTSVARAAGVAVGTLYNYFESKEEIFAEIIAHRCAEMRAKLAADLREGTPLENLRVLVRGSLENLEQQGALFAVFVERGAVGEYDLERLGGEITQREYQRFLSMVADVMRAAVRAGDLRSDVPVPTMVAALSGALNGATYAWLRSGRRGRLAAVGEDLIDLFLAGAQKPR